MPAHATSQGLSIPPKPPCPASLAGIVFPQAQVAVADVDNDGRLELVAADARGNLAAFTAEGKEVWETHLESQIHQVSCFPRLPPCSSCPPLKGLRAAHEGLEVPCRGGSARQLPTRGAAGSWAGAWDGEHGAQGALQLMQAQSPRPHWQPTAGFLCCRLAESGVRRC